MSSTLHVLSPAKYNPIGMATWDVPRKEWKIDNTEIKIIVFVIELGVKSIVAPFNEDKV